MKLIILRIVGGQADNPKDDTSMILDPESWMNIRRFRALHEAGATYKEIAKACGVDWRTVKKYLIEPAGATPPAVPSRRGSQPQVLAPYTGVIDAMLRADLTMKASVVYERLVAEHGYDRSYQRVKLYVAQARPRLAAEAGTEVATERMRGLHRRFETTPGAQAQVDWGEEGDLLAHAGIGKVYSFHMVLSYSRDPFGAAIRITYWLTPNRTAVLQTVFRKTRMREDAEVRRAKLAQKVCEAEHGPAHEEFIRTIEEGEVEQ